jgi:tRNA1Val (adenine37-N6)-methyltransferase
MKVTTDACLFGAWCADEIRKSSQQNCSLLDIGTGTGLLSLMIAQKYDCIIDAVEIDENATQQAAENINASPWKEKIQLHQKDILEFKEKKYSIIVSNPPFYEKELQSPNDKRNDAHHGTSLKLVDLFLYLKEHLSANGNFYLLLPYKRIIEAEKILNQKNLFAQKKIIVSTSPQHSPFRVLIKGGHEPVIAEESPFYITDEKQNYSKEFASLLKDYYLYL